MGGSVATLSPSRSSAFESAAPTLGVLAVAVARAHLAVLIVDVVLDATLPRRFAARLRDGRRSWGPAGQWRLEKLLEAATDGYRAAFPSSELVEFDDGGSSYLFDLTDDSTVARAPRVVAAWRRTSVAATPRNRSRQAGFPVSPALAGRGYERGHLLAHSAGGGLDENLFAQASHVNQGRSPGGRAHRQMERLAASHPGSLLSIDSSTATAAMCPI
jgi:hypothetical protein